MNRPSLDGTDLVSALERVGIVLRPDQLHDLLPGVAIMQELIDRVNMALPFEAEPAVTFSSEKQR